MTYQPLAVEDLQPIQEKLNEATAKIYEAIELAAQLKLPARNLGSIVSLVEISTGINRELLQLCERPVETEFNRMPRLGAVPGLARKLHPEEMEGMQRNFEEDMRERMNCASNNIYHPHP